MLPVDSYDPLYHFPLKWCLVSETDKLWVTDSIETLSPSIIILFQCSCPVLFGMTYSCINLSIIWLIYFMRLYIFIYSKKYSFKKWPIWFSNELKLKSRPQRDSVTATMFYLSSNLKNFCFMPSKKTNIQISNEVSFKGISKFSGGQIVRLVADYCSVMYNQKLYHVPNETIFNNLTFILSCQIWMSVRAQGTSPFLYLWFVLKFRSIS